MKLRTSREQGEKKSWKERNFMVKLRSSAKKKNWKTKKKSEEGNGKQVSKTNSHVESVK